MYTYMYGKKASIHILHSFIIICLKLTLIVLDTTKNKIVLLYILYYFFCFCHLRQMFQTLQGYSHFIEFTIFSYFIGIVSMISCSTCEYSSTPISGMTSFFLVNDVGALNGHCSSNGGRPHPFTLHLHLTRSSILNLSARLSTVDDPFASAYVYNKITKVTSILHNR